MAICLDILLVAGRYDAGGGQDPRVVEWPPHPARAFSALRSVAMDEDLPLLYALEQLPAPRVHASEALPSQNRSYVVTNRLKNEGGNLNHVGRTSGLRERRSVFPMNPHVQFIWDSDHRLSEHSIQLLDSLARRVSYLGRSTSVVIMGFRGVENTTVPAGLEVFEPAQSASSNLQLRIPYPGYTDELNALHDQGLASWQASDSARALCRYRIVDDQSEPGAMPSEEPFWTEYRDLVILRFRDESPSGQLIPILTAALRSMVMGQTREPLPPALHGHGFDGNPHVAYLGLPVCGNEFSDGHLVGLAVAIPGMETEERRRILRGVLGADGTDDIRLQVPGFRKPFLLQYQPDASLPRAATTRHWRRVSRQWCTVTPVVLDRYPKNRDLASAVLNSITTAGMPEPDSVEVSTKGMIPGAINFRPKELPRRARGRLFCHARVVFAQPVGGPIMAGAGRYFGVGLFQPEKNDRSQ